MHWRAVRPNTEPPDRRLRRRCQRDAEIRRVIAAVLDGELRTARHFRLCWRIHGDSGRGPVSLLDRPSGIFNADSQCSVYIVDVQARAIRRGGQCARRAIDRLNRRESGLLLAFAAGVLLIGLYPKPLTNVMHASVSHLLTHTSQSKLP